MKTVKRFVVLVAIFGLMFVVARNTAYAATCTSTSAGNWNTSGIWSCGHVPTLSDSVVIAPTHSVTIDVNTATVNSITINGTGTLTLNTGFTLATNGSITVEANGNFNMSAGTTNLGLGNNAFSNSGTANLTGGTMNIGGKFAMGSSSTTTINGATINIDPQATNTLSGSSHLFESPGAANFTFASGTVTLIDPNASTGANAIQIVSGGTKSLTGGTFQLGDGSSSTSGSANGFRVNCGGLTIGNLIITNPGGTNRFVQLQTNPCLLAGNLTIAAGELRANGENLSIASNFSNSGTFTAGSGAVTFNGSSAQNLTANTSTIFNNLIVNSGVTLVETVSSDNVTVSGTLTNNGTIRKAQTVSGAGNKTFGLAGAFNGANLTIDVTTPGTLSNLQVDRIDSNHPNSNGAYQQTGRYWSISATGGGFTADLTLPRNNAGTSSVCKYLGSGTSWSCAASGNTSNSVTRNSISSFSDWAVGNDAPTSAVLISFKAKLTPKHFVKVKWETGTETTLLGFNVYRQTVGAKKWIKVNLSQINAQNPGGITGAKYVYSDKTAKPGKTYRYKLEVLYTDGSSEWSETRKVTVP